MKEGLVNLNRVTYLVVDDADDVVDMKLTGPILEIRKYIRPDCQTIVLADYKLTPQQDLVDFANKLCLRAPPIQIWIDDDNPFAMMRSLNSDSEEDSGSGIENLPLPENYGHKIKDPEKS